MSIARFSIRRPVTTIMFFVSMVAIGLIAAARLPLEAWPDISFPAVFVQLPYDGSTPEEVERMVLRPAEDALATLPGIKRLTARANAEGAFLAVFYSDWKANVMVAASQVRERLDAARDQLPEDLPRYFVSNFSSNDEPVLEVRLASQADLSNAYALIDRQFKRPLERLPGVAKVEVVGAAPNEVEVAIDPQRLEAHGVVLNELSARLREVNFSVTAGQIEDGGRRLRVQPHGQLRDLQQLRDLPIGRDGLRLADIAQVRLKPQRLEYGRQLDGRPAVGLNIFKERGANLVQVTDMVMAEVERIGRESTLGIQIKVLQNQGEAVTGSLAELAEAGVIGLGLSIIVLFFFLRHWPSTLMVTLAIPICFVMTLGFMHFAGLSLNILSMMGLLLAIGMLVDNAVVVVESIYQERERMPRQPEQASVVGARRVAIALSAGTLCHCIVFLPNLFGEANDISIFMTQIAVTISVSLLASWLVAVSLIPMLSARLRTPPAVQRADGAIARLQRRYAGVLRWTLEHRGWSVFGIALVIGSSLIPASQVPVDMFGGGDDNETQIEYQWKGSYTKEQMQDEVNKVEAYLDVNRQRFHITQVYSYYSELQGGQTRVTFDRQKVPRAAPIVDIIRQELPKSARADLNFRGGDTGSGDGNAAVQVQLLGDSSQVLRELAKNVVPVLSRRRELRDVRVDRDDRNAELAVRVDRERAAAFGFSTDEVSQFIALALRGVQLREFQRGDEEVPVWVRFAGAEHHGSQDLAAFMVRAPDGRHIPLMSLTQTQLRPTDSQIERHDRRTSLTIVANLADQTRMPQAREAIEHVLRNLEFPPGYSYSFDGSGFERDQDAGEQMMFNLAIALILIYVVMAAVFESLLFPAAIMSGVVFSIFGVFWLFWLTGDPLSIMAFIGILVLMGVVVNNGIVMIEHINTLRRAGMSRTDALVAGGRERLRPILMTMGTAILAMVPIALSTESVDNMPPYHPMARAIAGGLTFSTLVSLLFLPTIYAVLDDLHSRAARILRHARRRERRGAGVDARAAPLG